MNSRALRCHAPRTRRRGLAIDVRFWWGFHLVVYALLSTTAAAMESEIHPRVIEQLTGAKGEFDSEEMVFRVSVSARYQNVTIDGSPVDAKMGLESWAAFTPAGPMMMVMCRLLLAENQVNPVIDVALESGLEITALYDPFPGDSPSTTVMHLGGAADEPDLAAAVGRVFAKLREPTRNGRSARFKADFATSEPTRAQLEGILGRPGEMVEGVYRFVIGRRVRKAGHGIGAGMGMATSATFAGDDKRAVVNGDFAVLETELRDVLSALRRAHIDIVAIHNLTVGEQPRLVAIAYWGTGPLKELARGIRAALDLTEHDDAIGGKQ